MIPRAGLDKDKTKADFTIKSSKGSHQFIEKADWLKEKRGEIRTKRGGCTDEEKRKTKQQQQQDQTRKRKGDKNVGGLGFEGKKKTSSNLAKMKALRGMRSNRKEKDAHQEL
jgi:hypothetical protein